MKNRAAGPGFADLPVTDCHVHFAHMDMGTELVQVIDELGISRFNVVCTPDRQRLSLVPDALHLKARFPERVYVFGGLDVSALLIAPDDAGAHFARYVDTLLEMGCDGLKMIEGNRRCGRSLGEDRGLSVRGSFDRAPPSAVPGLTGATQSSPPGCWRCSAIGANTSYSGSMPACSAARRWSLASAAISEIKAAG